MKKNANRFGPVATIGHVRWVLAMMALSVMVGVVVTPCAGQEADGADVPAALVRNQAQIAALRKEYDGVRLELYEIRRKHERSEAVTALHAAAKKANDAYEAKRASDPATLEARKAQRDAYNGAEMKAARDARSAAYAALSAKTKELLAADPEAAELNAKYKQLRKDLSVLEREARDLRKKGKAPSVKPAT